MQGATSGYFVFLFLQVKKYFVLLQKKMWYKAVFYLLSTISFSCR